MLDKIKKQLKRRQRATQRCAKCGQPGTLDTPLLYIVEHNRYFHDPYCIPKPKEVPTDNRH